MKKSCNYCKALVQGKCDLGYETKDDSPEVYKGLNIRTKPLEECPKPLTNNKFVELLNSKE